MIVYLYKKPKYDCFARNKTLTLHIDLYIFWRKPRLSLEQINDPDVESCKNSRKAIKSLDHTIHIYIFSDVDIIIPPFSPFPLFLWDPLTLYVSLL